MDLQLVWAESIYMGCGILYCPLYLASSSLDKDVFNIVCNYSPAYVSFIFTLKEEVLCLFFAIVELEISTVIEFNPFDGVEE